MVFTSDNAIRSAAANAYVQVDGRNYELFFGKSLEATVTKNKEEVRALGSRGVGHKAVSWQGSGTLTIHRVTSLFKQMMMEYINTGKDVYFSLVCTNEDEATPWGAETTILTRCNLDEIVMASFDTEDGFEEQEVPFTFEGVQLPQSFREV
jgi:hypothetical protein